MPLKIDYSKLPTEQINRHTLSLDKLSPQKLLEAISREDLAVPKIVRKSLPQITRAIQMTYGSLKTGGHLLLVGAGTSGRLGILEAAECPPTFDTPPSLVRAFMAGGRRAVFRSQEGAEDRGHEGRRVIDKNAKKGDVVIGISASGITQYVKEALKTGKRKGCSTILVTCHSNPPRFKFIDHVVSLCTGPEVIAGSTRLKAGTATKLALNMITVGTMVRLGKVYGNRMVDLQPRSRKLIERSLNLIQQLGNVNRKASEHFLREAKGNAKRAILMARKKISYKEAIKKLKEADGFLGKALEKGQFSRMRVS